MFASAGSCLAVLEIFCQKSCAVVDSLVLGLNPLLDLFNITQVVFTMFFSSFESIF